MPKIAIHHISAPDVDQRRPAVEPKFLGEFDELVRCCRIMTPDERRKWAHRRAAMLFDLQARLAATNILVARRGPGRPPRMPKLARAA